SPCLDGSLGATRGSVRQPTPSGTNDTQPSLGICDVGTGGGSSATYVVAERRRRTGRVRVGGKELQPKLHTGGSRRTAVVDWMASISRAAEFHDASQGVRARR